MARDEPWTVITVEAELRLAMWTLRRLPLRVSLIPAGFRVAWPNYVEAREEAYGYNAARAPRTMPSAEEITRMDRALAWTWTHLAEPRVARAGLPIDTAAIVLMRATGLPWPRIVQLRLDRWAVASSAGGRQIPGGNSIPSLRRAHAGGLALIVEALEGPAAVAQQVEALEASSPRLEQVVESGPAGGAHVVMAEDEQGVMRPVVRTLHYRAEWVTRPARRR